MVCDRLRSHWYQSFRKKSGSSILVADLAEEKKTGRKRTRTSLNVLIRSRPVLDFTRQCKCGVPSRSLMNKYLISYAIIANEYRLSILFALLPYVVREEVLLGTHACDRRKNFMDMRGYCGRRNRTRGRQKCNAFTPEN